MIKKIIFITVVPLTFFLEGAFVMKKGEPLVKVENQQEETLDDKTNTTSWNQNITTLVHPGVYHTPEELNSLRGNINSKRYTIIKNSNLRNIKPKGVASFNCGSHNKGDTTTCNNWYRDAKATEYWALRAYVEKNSNYATKSVEMIDEWAKVFQNVSGHNRALVASWQLYQLSRAIELLLHNNYGFKYPLKEKVRMEKYIDKIYNITQRKVKGKFKDDITSSQIGGNWVSSILAAKQSYWIVKHGLATNNTKRTAAINRFKYWSSFNDTMVKSYIYMNSDGRVPLIFDSKGIRKQNKLSNILGASLWRLDNNPQCFTKDGIGAEYWRDLWHMSMGLDFIGSMFEMSFIQGYKDDYSKHKKRLIAGLEVMYAALLKSHKGDSYGYYLNKTCSNTAATWKVPKSTTSSRLIEGRHAASLYKRAKEKRWKIPFMTEYNKKFMLSKGEKANAPYNNDYVFKQ